jgi:hypothetical protein
MTTTVLEVLGSPASVPEDVSSAKNPDQTEEFSGLCIILVSVRFALVELHKNIFSATVPWNVQICWRFEHEIFGVKHTSLAKYN